MKQHLIIGNSAAGIAAAEAIRKRDKESKVIIVSDEDSNSYCRCLISYYLAGEVKEDKIWYRPTQFYKENKIEPFLNKKVVRIDPKKNRVLCEDKTQINYDTLLIATGASAKFPEIKGIKKRAVFGFRTLKDIKAIEELLPITKTACVLGGGLIGLKAAYALNKKNINVKIIIKSNQVLSQVLDFTAAGFVQKRLEDCGIEVILGRDVSEIIGNGDIKAVKLDSGKAIEASLIIVGKGVSPNIDLVKNTDIKVHEGIIVNNLMQTNITNIWTAGDVAEGFDIALKEYSVNALWPIAIEQGRVAGANMAGERMGYEGSLGMNSLEFFGLPTVSLGVFKVGQVGYEEIKMAEPKLNIYKKLILKDNCLIGAVLTGDINKSGLYLRLIREKINVAPFKDRLLEGNFGFPDIMDFVKEKGKIFF